jgi:ferredoxin-NADP reductase
MIENWSLSVAIIALLSVSIAQFSITALRWHSHGSQSREQLRQRQTKMAHSSRVARLTSQLGKTSGSAAAIQWRILEVADVVQESVDCRSLYFVDPYGQPLPEFRPGQYVMVRPALAGAYQTTRCYSLSSSPDARYWRITVKLQDASDDLARANSGGLSAWIHRTIGKGDCLFVGGPCGQFYLPIELTRDIVLIAAGIGITPMASMLRWSLEETPDRNVTLLYQAKNSEHWPLGKDIHKWQKHFASLQIHTFFSRADAEEIGSLASELPGTFISGKFDGKTAVTLADNPDTDYYMCGPETWMEQMREQLVACGVPASQIHWESFGSQAAPISTESSDFEARTIRFALSDIETQWHDPSQSIWELAKANHIELPSGCLSGVCGSCRVKLISGQVQYDRQIGVELASGECLTCVACPNTDLVLEA